MLVFSFFSDFMSFYFSIFKIYFKKKQKKIAQMSKHKKQKYENKITFCIVPKKKHLVFITKTFQLKAKS